MEGHEWKLTRSKGKFVLVLFQTFGEWKADTRIELDADDPAGKLLWELTHAAQADLQRQAGAHEPQAPQRRKAPKHGPASMSVEEAFDLDDVD